MRRALRTAGAVGARQMLSSSSTGRSFLSRVDLSESPNFWTRHAQISRSCGYGTLAASSGQPGVSSQLHDLAPGKTVATITISNPSKLNIVNSSILSQLTKTCADLRENASLRCVILNGGPTAPGKSSSFIGGADIKEMNALSSSSEARSFIQKISGACQAIRSLPVPVIAQVDGFCLGAGLEIMASCDLRIATRNSVFGMPEVKIGIPSVVEAALLPGLIGMGRTRRLLYLAENIGAEEAERWGLVERIVEDEQALSEAVTESAEKIAEMGPEAMRSQKKLMQRWENCSVDEGIEAGVEAFAKAFDNGGKEPKELMGKFLGRSR